MHVIADEPIGLHPLPRLPHQRSAALADRETGYRLARKWVSNCDPMWRLLVVRWGVTSRPTGGKSIKEQPPIVWQGSRAKQRQIHGTSHSPNRDRQ